MSLNDEPTPPISELAQPVVQSNIPTEVEPPANTPATENKTDTQVVQNEKVRQRSGMPRKRAKRLPKGALEE